MAGTLVANTINTDTGLFSTNNAYSGIAKAWVNFAGASGTINGSFNVSSVTYTTTGDYTVNFTTAMPNATYSAVSSCGSSSTRNGGFMEVPVYQALSTTSVRVGALLYTGSTYNPTYVSVSIFSS